MKYLSTVIFSCITALLLSGIGFYALQLYIDKIENEKRLAAQRANILDGIQAEPTVVRVDYSKQIAEGSPLIFGGSHAPPADHKEVWEQFKDVGITSIRRDLYIEFTLPRNITIEDYKSNRNGVADPANWDKKTIPALKETFKNAKERDIKVIGIMGYAPRWLTTNGTAHGVPKDWNVFKDIVKKIYTLYRDDLDYVEIWNEPDHRIFLVTDGTSLSKQEAYAELYHQATEAIRGVDREKNDGKVIPIIGGVESNPRVSNILPYLMTSPKTTVVPNIFSFHTYDSFIESYTKYKNIAIKSQNQPIFITEWNLESRTPDAPKYKTGIEALTFTSARLIDYLNNGVGGANYFALLPINTINRGTDENTMGFYRWINNHAELLPQGKSWKLLSSKLGLGKGKSRITQTTNQKLMSTVGFINSENIKGAAISNETGENQLIEFRLVNTGIKKRARVDVYIASAQNDVTNPISSKIVYVEDPTLTVRYAVPANSVIGIKIYEETEWYDIFDALKLE